MSRSARAAHPHAHLTAQLPGATPAALAQRPVRSLRANPAQVWDVPAAWSLKDAATVPVAYLTAYYALLMRAGMRKGQSVLVHSGTGAVGLAAIRIARFRGCEARARPA